MYSSYLFLPLTGQWVVSPVKQLDKLLVVHSTYSICLTAAKDEINTEPLSPSELSAECFLPTKYIRSMCPAGSFSHNYVVHL